MPKGPRGEKRPADVIGWAVNVTRIATGEEEDDREPVASAAAQLGKLGGAARARQLSPERRKAIARKAAKARWAQEEQILPARSQGGVGGREFKLRHYPAPACVFTVVILL